MASGTITFQLEHAFITLLAYTRGIYILHSHCAIRRDDVHLDSSHNGVRGTNCP